MSTVQLAITTPTTVQAGVPFTFQVSAFTTNGGKFVRRGGYVGNVGVHSTDDSLVPLTPVNIPSEMGIGTGTLTPTRSGQLQLFAFVDTAAVQSAYSNFITVESNAPTQLVLLNPPQLTMDTGEVLPMAVSPGVPIALTVQVQDQYNNPVTSFTWGSGAQIIGYPSIKTIMNPPIVNGNATIICTFTKEGSTTFTIIVPFFEVQVTLDVVVLPI